MSIENGKRWANTFLSIANAAHAIPDEVLIDKESGHLYYKNLAGEVIDIFSNIVIDSSDVSETLSTLNQAITDSVIAANQYTDEQIQLGGGGNGTYKTVYYRYNYVTKVDGETEVEIPLTTHNINTDLLILSVNTTLPDEGYTVTDRKITFHEGLDIDTGVSMIILKNMPLGDEGAVHGNIFIPGTITEDKLDQLLVAKINNGPSGSAFVVSDTEPIDQSVGGLWMQVIPTV